MEIKIMFIFSVVCFIGGLLIGYSIWAPNQKQEQKNGE